LCALQLSYAKETIPSAGANATVTGGTTLKTSLLGGLFVFLTKMVLG